MNRNRVTPTDLLSLRARSWSYSSDWWDRIWIPLVVLVVLNAMGAALLGGPLQAAFVSSPDSIRARAAALLWVTVAVSPVAASVSALFVAAFAWGAGTLASEQCAFRRAFLVGLYAECVLALASVAIPFGIRLRGMNLITHPADLAPSLGLDAFIDLPPGILTAVARQIGPLQLVAFAVIGIGLRNVSGLGERSSWTAATLAFVFTLLVSIARTGLTT
jgi:hypothetical protein